MKNKINLGYGTTVELETLVAFAKSNTAADLMWYMPGLRSAITAESGHRSTHPAPHHWRLGFDKRDKPHMPRTGESY